MTGQSLYSYEIDLAIEAPFLIGGSSAARFGLDSVQIRNPDGKAIIPDTHFKGVLRAAWQAVEAEGYAAPLSRVQAFGAEGSDVRTNVVEDGKPLEPAFRGCLMFRDLIANSELEARVITRVAIDDDTGAASTAQLQTVEMIAQPGASIGFSGRLLAWLPSQGDADALRSFLETALDAVFAIGKGKSVGFGQVVARSVSEPVSIKRGWQTPKGGADFNFSFQLDKAVLVDITRPDSNTMVGAETISGAVLKGALAEKLRRCGRDPSCAPYDRVLSRMVISHAQPTCDVPKGDEACWQPSLAGLSAVALRQDKKDVASLWDHTLALPVGRGDPVPAFSGDEKAGVFQSPAAPHAFTSRLRPIRDVRTRNAIHPTKGIAEDGKLFVQSSIHPSVKDKPLVWTGHIHWPDQTHGPDHQHFMDIMELFAGGLTSIGKGDSATLLRDNRNAVGVTIDPWQDPKKLALNSGSTVEITIATPCLMLREHHLVSEQQFANALAAYWSLLGNGAFQLAIEADEPLGLIPGAPDATYDFFCRVELRAGYQALRYGFFGDDILEPFVLTEPGSVFRLEILEPGRAGDILDGLCRTGLPVARWTESKDNPLRLDAMPDHRNCPFVPQNGFGEIAVRVLEDLS